MGPPTTPSSASSSNANISKALAQFAAANRSCADCRVTLMDPRHVHASYSPLPVNNDETDAATISIETMPGKYNQFQRNHRQWAPPAHRRPPALSEAPSMDPSPTAAQICFGGHGVLVCSLCGAAHKLLGMHIAVVRALHDPTEWTNAAVAALQNRGGNARARLVLERFANHNALQSPPKANSSIAERLIYCRSKYEALAFLLPSAAVAHPLAPPVVRATRAWHAIVDRHTSQWEWSGGNLESLKQAVSQSLSTMGGDIVEYDSMRSASQQQQNFMSSRHLLATATAPEAARHATLPQRLVDAFCVVVPDEASRIQRIVAPSENCFEWQHARVVDQYPATEADLVPEGPMLGSLVFPNGCRASMQPLPPSFFTTVLTDAQGIRQYAGVLILHEETTDWASLEAAAAAAVAEQQPPRGTTSTNGTTTDTTSTSPNNSAVDPDTVLYKPKALVVLSHYPFWDLWRKFLLRIYRIALVEAPLPLERFVAHFCRETPLPPPGYIRVKVGFSRDQVWNIERPPPNRLPLANFSWQPLLATLSITNLLVVVGCLLQEDSVALFSKHVALLTPVAEALVSLLFPFHWQGMYLPVCPYHMKDILNAPVPFLVGMSARYLTEQSPSDFPPTVVLVDLDQDVVHLQYTDEACRRTRRIPALPDRQVAKLKAKLELLTTPYVAPPALTSRPTAAICGRYQGVFPEAGRELYARSKKATTSGSNGHLRRRDVLERVDQAYRDNELLVPIDGFFSEHGQIYSDQKASSSAISSSTLGGRARSKKALRMRNRTKATGGSSSSKLVTAKGNGVNGMAAESNMKSLLDLAEPEGFSSEDMREAFLGLFLSVFKNYRQFFGDEDDDNSSKDEDPKEKGSSGRTNGTNFREQDFIQSLNLTQSSLAFFRNMVSSQYFARFLYDRQEIPDDPEILFFEQSINDKLNRSKKETLSKLGRGNVSKRPTNFLHDKSMEVQETFTPPPPSNWGLPDDERTYQYSSFPLLDPSLFGKVREPISWSGKTAKTMSRRVSQRFTGTAQVNERLFFPRGNDTPRSPQGFLNVTRRGVKGLEAAIGALSMPFSSNRGTEHAKSIKSPASVDTRMSEVTLPSTLQLEKDEISVAEEIVLNARRKQAILIGIVSQFQRACRANLEQRKHKRLGLIKTASDKTYEAERARALETIRNWASAVVPGRQARRRFLRTRGATIEVQSFVRGWQIKLAYSMIIYTIRLLQARVRGYLARKSLRSAVLGRLKVYREHLFAAWARSRTPLSFRTSFWPFLDDEYKHTFLAISLAESELDRLWAESSFGTPDQTSQKNGTVDGLVAASEKLGMNVRVLTNCSGGEVFYHREVGVAAVAAVPKRRSILKRDSSLGSVSHHHIDRLTRERSQVYEALSLPGRFSPSDMSDLVDKFGVSTSRKKKAALAEAVWQDVALTEYSVELLTKLFPDIATSGITLSSPSKKAAKRFRLSVNSASSNLRDQAALGSILMGNLVRRNNAEVARLGITKMPQITEKLVGLGDARHLVVRGHNYSWKTEQRRTMMRKLLG